MGLGLDPGARNSSQVDETQQTVYTHYEFQHESFNHEKRLFQAIDVIPKRVVDSYFTVYYI